MLLGFMKTEIDASQLNIDDIELFIRPNDKQIVDFAQLLLEKDKPQFLSVGISITYAIYMIYLKDKSSTELLEYLKRRRIPKPQKLLAELVSIGKRISL